MTNFSDDGHIPSPFSWSDEDRRKYGVLVDGCPHCKYKFAYAERQNLIDYFESKELSSESAEGDAILHRISEITEECLAIGLVNAGEQCKTNSIMFSAILN